MSGVQRGKYRYLKKNDNTVWYTQQDRKEFIGDSLDRQKQVFEVMKFAYAMACGDGHHRAYRSGGQYSRKKGELFCNTFQGKLAEVFIHQLLLDYNLECAPLDFGIYGESIWDDTDLIVNDKKISIKSAAYFSQLFLLETKDWTTSAEYKPNLNKAQSSIYDYFVLIRISPDIKKIFKDAKMYYADNLSETDIINLVRPHHWEADFAGYISRDNLIHIINNGYIIQQNSLLQKKIPMDAENYYILASEMGDLSALIKELQGEN